VRAAARLCASAGPSTVRCTTAVLDRRTRNSYIPGAPGHYLAVVEPRDRLHMYHPMQYHAVPQHHHSTTSVTELTSSQLNLEDRSPTIVLVVICGGATCDERACLVQCHPPALVAILHKQVCGCERVAAA